MIRNPPLRLFGFTVWACHGVPATVMLLSGAAVGFLLFESASQFVKPVELTALWAEPRTITVAEIMAQTPGKGALHLSKTGKWNRLCDVVAEQSFIDYQGTVSASVRPHRVETPSKTGPFEAKARGRGVQIPKTLAAAPGIYRFRIENKGTCWWFERFLPIGGMSAEAAFEIVP